MLSEFIRYVSSIVDSASAIGKVKPDGTNLDIKKFINKSDEFKSVQRVAEKSILPFPVVLSSNISTDTALIMCKSVEKNMAQSILAIVGSSSAVVNAGNDAASATNNMINRFRGLGRLTECIDNQEWGTLNEMTSYLLESHKMSPLLEEYNLEIKNIVVSENAFAGVGGAMSGPSKSKAFKPGKSHGAPSALNISSSATTRIDPAYVGVGGGSNSPSAASKYTPGATPANVGQTTSSVSSVEIVKAHKFEAKLASMDPTYIKVTFKLANGASTSDVVITLGVKSTAHLVNGEQLSDAIVKQLLNDDFTTSFVRWTTGEISFFKDLVLNYNTIKNAALTNGDNYAQSIVANLSRNASKSKMADVSNGQAFIPNTTIVLSRDDVNNIRINTKQDLMKPMVAKNVIEKLNLAALIIVDEVSDAAYVIFDSELSNQYEMVSIRGESRDNDSKKVLSKIIGNLGG